MIDADLQIIMYANIIHDVAKSPIDWYDWLYGPLMMQTLACVLFLDCACGCCLSSGLRQGVENAGEHSSDWLMITGQ